MTASDSLMKMYQGYIPAMDSFPKMDHLANTGHRAGMNQEHCAHVPGVAIFCKHAQKGRKSVQKPAKETEETDQQTDGRPDHPAPRMCAYHEWFPRIPARKT